MNKSARIFPLFILVATLLIAGIAATPATLAQPDGPSVQANFKRRRDRHLLGQGFGSAVLHRRVGELDQRKTGL